MANFNLKNKINLVAAFMEFEGNTESINIGYSKKGVTFSGYIAADGEAKHINIFMDKLQVKEINNCKTVMEIYDCYKQMEYF